MSFENLGLSPDIQEAINVGEVSCAGHRGTTISLGEVFKLGRIFELSLYFLPTKGEMTLSFERDIGRGRVDLNAIVPGPLFDVEEVIGQVELRNLTGKISFDVVPAHMEETRLYFAH